MIKMAINALWAHRINISNRKYIAPTPKRFINSSVNFTGTVTKLGHFTNSNGLDFGSSKLGFETDALVSKDQISSFVRENRPSAEMKIKTTYNGHETTQLPVVKLPQNPEKFKTDVDQLVDTVGNVSTEVKTLGDTYTSDCLTQMQNLFTDCISISTAIDNLALSLGGRISIRLLDSLGDLNWVSRPYILKSMSIETDLHIITIDRFEIFISNITWEPFFYGFLPRIHELIIKINSYELSGFELCNTTTWLRNKLGTLEDYNSLLKVKHELILNNYYTDMSNLMDIIQALGEGQLFM